ncbi:MAG: RNA polymerase sigma factor [Gammaproteobacteria bacterium]|nr:RNA polymerase sigma factor [Gammaproteobacteria bacterium]
MLNPLAVLKCAFCELAGSLEIASDSTLVFRQASFTKRNEVDTLENREALNQFLTRVEKRAFRIAELATSSPDHAMDIVQDAMLSLAKNYSHKNEADWGPLFHKILQSKIRDWYRRSRTRNKVFTWLRGNNHDDGDELDPIQRAADTVTLHPDGNASNEQLMNVTLDAIRHLPLRQQQAFLLRTWEGLDVRETARAMGCSEGSVKTHYSRATRALKKRLEAYIT